MAAARRASVTVWTHGPKDLDWAKQRFEDHGHADLIRVSVDFLVGSGPDADDLQLDNRVVSELEPDGQTTRDTHQFVGGGYPSEVSRDNPLIFLGSQIDAELVAEAKATGRVEIDERPAR